MKSRVSFLLNLIIVLSLVLSAWPANTQAETPATEPEPASLATQPASGPSPTLAVQSPEPEWKEQGDFGESTWKVWEALSPEVKAKVDPRILAELKGQVIPAHLGGGPEQADVAPGERKPLDKTRFLVYLKAKAGLEIITQQSFATRVARRTAVFDALVNTARATQGPVKAFLDARMGQGNVASYQPFYIFNGFAIEGDLDTIIELALRDDIEHIVANYPLVPLWESGKAAAAPADDLGSLDPDNWNIDLVDAERVWDEFGITGRGAVVGGFDTGVDYTHPALVRQYRGNLGSGIFHHSYNWFEADSNLYPGGALGPSVSTVPRDCHGHGTHTMGTMVGDGGIPGTQVGMAPGAKWIAAPGICNNTMPGGIGDDVGGIKTFQWFLCPTDLSGDLTTADCSKAPDAVNNSWGSANPADNTFRPIIQALRAAGIAPVFSAGNPSAGLGSIGAPANAPEAITVGATDINDSVASFSGRGPSFYKGEQKPELSAPGVNVNSTLPGGDYSGPTWSGTSMAAPHVAGLIALMVSADLQDGYRDLNVDELEFFMASTAVDLGAPGPDNDYGYGRIDAYDAVRWARSAGDLRGTVRDASTSAAIEGATVTGVSLSDTFTTRTDASGQYSTTVPAGTYDVIVDAWGYHSDTFPGQTVITSALSIADFSLAAMPAASLTGQVLSGTTPISGALIYVATRPSVSFTTGADGSYALTLPLGTHGMVVEATGYRILREDVSVASGGSAHDFSMTPAPAILLVDADTHYGWFFGWPVHDIFQWALDQENYWYDLWRVQYTTFNDTQVMPDGSLGYGIPSLTTLGSYDLVIWAHGGGGWGTTGSTVDMGADDELMAYLDSGGRLVISGQDLSWDDRSSAFHNDYLHADFVMNTAAGEGETVSGQSFLGGLNLEITNASLHGYDNGVTLLSPDAVAPKDGAAFPVLIHDNGNGVAALAVDPCDAPYRAVYLALGYENIGPRADNRDLAIAKVLDRSISWVVDSKPTYGVSVAVNPSRQVGESRSTVSYDLQVINVGLTVATFELSLDGNAWPTRILSGTTEVTMTMDILPCSLQDLTLEVDIPATADTGDQDAVAVTASRYPAGTPSSSVDVTTVAFPLWKVEPDAPYAASRISLVGWGNSIYLMGGDGGTTIENYEFDACTLQWIARAPIPVGIRNHAAAAMDGKVYVTGGAVVSAMDNLQIYDIASDTWSAGASMPEARWAHATVALNGEIYVVGGLGRDDTPQATTFAYNPELDSWRAVVPMNSPRFWVAGTALNGKLYVVGGAGELNTVEEYDPATDTWTIKAPMLNGRAAPGATSVGDYLYVVGGGYDTYLPIAERYDPAADAWEAISSLNTGRRTLGVAYAAGKIFAANGWYGDYSNDLESLRLSDTFCNSGKSVLQSTVQPGDRITYTVEIHADPVELTSVSLVDPIPAGTTFAGFDVNPIGAIYDGTDNQVEWSGTVPAKVDPLIFTFGVDVATGGWTFGDPITNAVTFDSGAGLVFTRTVTSVLSFPDASPSTKMVDKSQALAGDVLTFTLHVQNGSAISDVFTLRDPLPAGTTYVPGSLTLNGTLGTAGYDPVNDVITWTGTLPDVVGYVPGDYEWGDSDGNGTVPGVTFDWMDISGTGTNAGTGDDSYYCGLPIGFTFNFYGTDETAFCGSTNGFVSFDPSGYSDLSNDCPLPSTWGNAALIAGIWDDLVTDGGIYYQTFGTAPNRYLVVQWVDVRHYGGSTYFDFEIILYENGAIKVQMLDAGPELGSGSTTGVEDYSETRGVTYACDTAGSIHDNLAVLFQPIIVPLYNNSASVTFAVTLTTALPDGTPVTNTAYLDNSYGDLYDLEAVFLARSSNLSASFKQAVPEQVAPGGTVTYTVYVHNGGAVATTGEMRDELPPELTYVPGSLLCGTGSCGYASGVITWTGMLGSRSMVPVRFRATVSSSDDDLLTNTAVVTDVVWMTGYPVESTVRVLGPPIYGVKLVPPVDAQSGVVGTTVTYMLRLTNTGNTVDSFDLIVSGNTWATNVPPSIGPLVAGTGQDVQVTVDIPADASGSDTATVTVTSRGNPSVRASSVLSTTATAVVPPLPKFYLPLVLRNF